MCNQGWDIFISKSRRHRAPVTASISYTLELDSVLDFISPPLPPRHARSRVLTCTRVVRAHMTTRSNLDSLLTVKLNTQNTSSIRYYYYFLPFIPFPYCLRARGARSAMQCIFICAPGPAHPARPSLLLGMQIVSDILPFRRSEGLSAGPEH